MYDYNTLEGKTNRVEELHKLQAKIASVPGKYLSYSEARSLGNYLGDIIYDLEKQIKKERKIRQDTINRKVVAVNKALFELWGTEKAEKIWEELEKCKTQEEIAQLYDFLPDMPKLT